MLIFVLCLKHTLDRKQRVIRVAKFGVEFDHIKRDERLVLQSGQNNVPHFVALKTFVHSGACAVNKGWVQSIDVKADVDRFFAKLLDVVNRALDIEHANVLFLDCFAFEFVDVADSAVCQFVKL